MPNESGQETVFGFIPLSKALPYWPSDLFGEPDFLDEIGIRDFNVTEGEKQLSLSGTFLWLREIKFNLPAIEGFSLVLLNENNYTTVPFQVSILPEFLVALPQLSITLQIESELLRPVKNVNGKWEEQKAADGKLQPVQVTLAGVGIAVDGDGDFEIQMPAGGPQASIGAVMLGETGFVLEINGLTPYFSSKQTPPDGAVPGFKGIGVQSAIIHFPPDLNIPLECIELEKILVGTGGFSGKVKGLGNATFNSSTKTFEGRGAGSIFDIPFALREVSLEFKQNTFVESKIEGAMILPFFDQPVVCSVNLTNDGDFTVALAADQTLPPGVTAPEQSSDGLFVFTKEDLVKLKLKSIAFRKENDIFSISLGGDIKPLVGGIDWPQVEIKSLTIDSKGNVRIDGGWIEIPKQACLDFNGFKLELTKIGFGNETDGSRWIGLSGGINIVEGIPLKGGVDGLRLIWKDPVTDISNIRIAISGINVAFRIQDVLKFDGRVYFIDEGTKKGFKGGVKITLYPLQGMMLDAQFMAGRNELAPPYNFFYIYIAVELPIGLPLGSTGAALFGMAGLFGYNTTVDKRDNEAWFENDDGSAGFYLRGEKGITSVTKWTDRRDALAFGAGLTLGTASDNGFTFAGKVLLVVLIPGPMILIEGKAQFLKERKNLSDDPIFRMLAVLDVKAGTFLFNVQAHYKYPDDGKVIEIGGTAEAFFNFNNPNVWHFYVGQDTPEAKRIRATILSLFTATAYFMIDPKDGLRMGAWIGYDKSWKFGPLAVILQAWIEGRLALSVKPPQASGSLALVGNVQLKAFGVGLGLSISALLAAKAPNPWYVYAEFKVALDLPWPLPDPSATVTLEWQEPSIPPWPVPLAKVGIEHLKVSEKWELERSPKYDADADGYLDAVPGSPSGSPWTTSPIMPLDARPVLTFARPVADQAQVGSNYRPAPAPERVGDYTFSYRLTQVTLHKMPTTGPASSWTLVASSEGGAPRPLFGTWQVVTDPVYGEWQGDADTASPSNTKLMLWTTSPFEISRELESDASWRYSMLSNFDGYPCLPVTEPKDKCVNFKELPVDSRFYSALDHKQFLFCSWGNYLQVQKCDGAWAGTDRALGVEARKAKDEVVCLDFETLKTGTNAQEINCEGVIFTGAVLPSGEVSQLQVADRYPSGGDGRNDIWIPWSAKNASAFASIGFPSGTFPKGPDWVTVDCAHYSSLTLRAFDDEGNLLAAAPHTAGQKVLQQLILKGESPVRRIDIEGAEAAIVRLCYGYKAAQEPDLLVVLPEEVVCVGLSLVQGSKGEVEFLSAKKDVIGTIAFDIPAGTPNGQMRPVQWEADAYDRAVKGIVLKGTFLLLKVCGITKADAERADQEIGALTHLKDSLNEYWGLHEACILEPNHYYKLSIRTEIERNGNGGTDSKAFEESSYFQTQNPPGAYDPGNFPEATNGGGENEYGAVEHYPAGGPLKDPSVYIASTIPPQVASNEPMRPAYRSYDVGIEFNESKAYVDQMYQSAGLPLKVKLFDNNDRQVVDANGQAIEADNVWSDNPGDNLTREETNWQVVLKANCQIDLTGKNVIRTTTLMSGASGLVMQPATIYKARICAGPYRIYQFSFLTSRYCTFTHHVQSFADAAWDHHRLQAKVGLTGSAFPSDLQTKLAAVVAGMAPTTTCAPGHRFAEDEAIRFEQLMELFGLAPRSLPERLELAVINDDTHAYAQLLEGPEPLDWKRIQMSVMHSASTEPMAGATGPLKLLDAAVATSSASGAGYNDEWVEFLVQTQFDLNGVKIRHKNSTAGEYSDYYCFATEQIVPAGTVVRVHSGKAGGLAQDERTHFFRASDASGEGWQFDAAGEWLVLEGPDGKPLHSRIVKPASETPKSFILVRSQDETRAFLIVTGGPTDGKYRLEFEFYREQNGLPTLMRAGSKSKEKTCIEYNYPATLPIS